MPPLRIGVVGAGFVAGRHVQSLTSLPDVVVAAVCDPQLDRAAALCGTAYPDVHQMLDREPLDAVYVCVPPYAHGEPERAALARGLPLFVEKPLDLDLSTAEEQAAEIDAAGVPTATGFHWRYYDTVERAAELLADRPPRLVSASWLDRTPGSPWWAVRDCSGGQLMEQATHLFDLCRLLAGAVTTTCLLPRGHRVGLEVVADGMVLALTERELVIDDGERRTVPVGVDPLRREDADFLAAVRGEPVTPRAPYAEALRSHQLTVAVARAAVTGVPVTVPGPAPAPAGGA